MTSLPTVDFEVAGIRYQTTLLDAVTGRKLYLRILKAAAPGLAKLADGEDKSGVAELFAVALAEVIGSIPEDLFDDLCNTFAASTIIPRQNGITKLSDKEVFGAHFAGKYKDLTDWFIACMKANKFLDFLSAISDRVKDALSKASAFQSRTT